MASETLNIVVPFFNEELVIEEFHKRLMEVINHLDISTRVIYVDDGSTDNTGSILKNLATSDERLVILQLSRNFGHQSALSAGLDYVDGDIIITMDGDGQHPPKLIPQLIEMQKKGFDVVQAQYINSGERASAKTLFSKLFYYLINKLGDTIILEGTSDYRLITRQVLEAYRRVHDYHRFIRGIIPWLGFSEAYIQYTPEERIAGESKYTFKKMLHLAENAVFSFSLVPLRIGLFTGLLFLLLSCIEFIYVISFWILGKQALLQPGWSSIVFLILITGGVLMILISILGIYIGQINQQVKERPLYIIKSIYTAHEQ